MMMLNMFNIIIFPILKFIMMFGIMNLYTSKMETGYLHISCRHLLPGLISALLLLLFWTEMFISHGCIIIFMLLIILDIIIGPPIQVPIMILSIRCEDLMRMQKMLFIELATTDE